MKTLQGISVLCAGVAAADQQALDVWIASEGAALHKCPWTALHGEIQRLSPDVVLADFRPAPEVASAQLLALPAGSRPPVVALVERGAPGAALAAQGTCNKYIAMPAHPGDVVGALASLAAVEARGSTAHEPMVDAPSRRVGTLETSIGKLLEGCAARNDLRGFLALVNATGPFRFTSILRFDEDERLTSLWTFDRENQAADTFPIDATTPSSYCVLVRAGGAPFVMPDAALEPKVANHPKRYAVLSYVGVPLYDDAAAIYGTLCSYDVAPRFVADDTVTRLEETALILRKRGRILERDPSAAR